MRRGLSRLILFTIVLVSVLLCTQGQTPPTVDKTPSNKVYYFELHEDIGPSSVRIVDRALEEAVAMRADYIVMSLDSYGGLLDAGDTIHVKLLRCKIPVLCYVTNNAASAGALIALSCDSIYMSPFAKIGAASVVDQEGNVVNEKYQAYMRGIMRSTAEANGRDPEIAEAMVQGGGAVPGVIDSGKILTFTTSEAIKNGYCEGEVNSVEDVLMKAQIQPATITEYKMSGMDKVMAFLLNPILRGLCITFIFLGIYFELQTPGIGFALVIAIIAALLYFAPLYVEGLAANWEILLFVIGLILIALEIFVVPGFGVTGVSGIILIFSGLVLSMIKNVGFNFEMSGDGTITESILVVLSAFVISLGVMFAFFGRFANSALFKKISLQTVENHSDGYNSTLFQQPATMIGKVGVAMSDLRPSGKIKIDDEWYDGQSEGDYILKGQEIIVVQVMNAYLIVRLK
ncbi:MAG: nodulation protein NfeD [Bacteroidetes bacterium]|nr:nodulation protein NfeD [Bacteroidota bacterium]